MRVRRKQSTASSGVQTIGSFSLKLVFNTTGIPALRWDARSGCSTVCEIADRPFGAVREVECAGSTRGTRPAAMCSLPPVASNLGGALAACSMWSPQFVSY